MDKATAIQKVNDHFGEVLLSSGNTHFSNINASQARDFWWLNIPPRKFKSELHILLVKKDDNGLIWLRVKANAFPNPSAVFKTRDNGKMDLEICSDDTDARYMRDVRGAGYDFRPHIAHEWEEIVAARKPEPKRKSETSRRPKPKPRIAKGIVVEVRRAGKRVYYAGDVLPPLVDLDQVDADGPVFEGTDVPVAYMFAYLDEVRNLYAFLQDFPEVNFEQAVAAMWKRAKANMVAHSDVGIVSGTPVFTGTRVPIDILFDCLSAGENLDEFLEGFPTVSREQAIDALNLAKQCLDSIAYETAHR